MATLAQLLVKITGDTAHLQAALGAADRKLSSLGAGASKLGGLLGSALKTGGLMAAGGLGVATAAGFKFAGVASDLNESMSKVEVVFGKNADAVKKWASTASTSIGQSKQEALEAAGTFGNLFSALGLTSAAGTKMSMDIVKLSADLASFNNIAGSDATEKLRAGLVGEAEPLRTLGVNITAATTEAKALELGFQKINGTFTESEKVQARYALILDQTKNAQGDFARTADGAANSQRILSATWKDTQATLGQIMLPLLKEGSRELSNFLVNHQADIDAFSVAFAQRVPEAFSLTKGAIETTAVAFRDVASDGRDMADSLLNAVGVSHDLRVEIGLLGVTLAAVFPERAALSFLAGAIINLRVMRTDSEKLSDAALDFQIAWLHASVEVGSALDDLNDKFTAPLRKLGDVLGFLGKPLPADNLLNKASDALSGVHGLQGAEETAQGRLDQAEAEKLKRYGASIKDNLTGALDELDKASKDAGEGVGGVTGGLSGAGGGGGGGLSAAAKAAQESLIDMALAFADFHAATGLGEQDFMALIQLSQDKAALDKQATQAGIALAAAQMEATDGSFQLRKGLVAMAEKAIEMGGSLPRAIEAALRGLTDQIRGAFNGLFNRPTKEGAELDLQIALLEEKLAREKATGATDEETKGLQENIERLRTRKDVLDKHANVLKAQIELADKTLITEEQRDFAAQLYTIALGSASAQLDQASALVSLQGIAQANYVEALNSAAQALGGSSDNGWTPEMKGYVNAFARGKGEPEPFPGFAMGTAFVPRDMLAVLHRGERVVTAAANRRASESGVTGGTTIVHKTVNVYPQNINLQGDAEAGLASLSEVFV